MSSSHSSAPIPLQRLEPGSGGVSAPLMLDCVEPARGSPGA